MNTLGIALVWCALQVTLVALFSAIVYFATRRVAPAASALTIQTSLLVCALLTVLSLSPWPRWSTLAKTPVETSADVNPTISESGTADTIASASPSATSADFAPTPGDNVSAEKPLADGADQFASVFWNRFVENLQHAPEPQPAKSWSWPTILAGLFLVGMVLALLRVVLGLRAVSLYRRTSEPISDQRLLELVDVVCAELSCHRKLQIRESAELATPATTGWRQPVIFLPVDWQNWTDAQCRAVLAHEISHIDRNDFLTSLCARVGVAVHFYHPLVHWLMQRLTLEQELAADADAARVAGGQRNYLMILAEMALAQSNQPIRWPARTFLPTRGTFLRRIEMLRDSNSLSRSVSRRLRALVIGIVLIAGITAAGIRAPLGALADAGAEPTSTTASTPRGIELTYVPSDAVFVAAVRPAEILAKSEWKPLIPLIDDIFGRLKLLNTSVSSVEQISLVLVGQPSSAPGAAASVPLATQNFGVVIVRMKEPNDFSAVLHDSRQLPAFQEQEIGGKKYFVAQDDREAYFRPDDRTIVLGPEYQITRLIANGADSQSALLRNSNWQRVSSSPAAIIVDGQWARTVNFGVAGPLLAMVSPLMDESKSLAAALAFEKEIGLSIFADCRSEAGATNVKQTCDALVTLGRNAIRKQSLPAEMTESQRGIITGLFNAANTMLNTATVEQQNNLVSAQLRLPIDGNLLAQVTTQAAFAGESAREATARQKAVDNLKQVGRDMHNAPMQSRNNLKKIGLAMHNFHDQKKRFPKPVEMGPDGKTPHSWRVALLPYLDQTKLYDEYNLNEPWDSETNKKVLEKMPDVFRYPTETNDSNAAYYVFVGKGTMFEPDKETSIKHVTDGTSNTLLVVEAERKTPWTKPEDIPYDPEKDPPAFGGFIKEGANVLMADGSARFFTTGAAKKQMLKYLIEKADQHPVEFP